MRIIARKVLSEYGKKHNDAAEPIRVWYFEAKQAEWKKPADIKQRYSKASIMGDNRVVFNIAGNKHRLVVKIHYNKGIIFIRFIGTHKEYDRIDAENI